MRLIELGTSEILGKEVLLFQLESGDLSPEYAGWLKTPEVTRYLEVRFQPDCASTLDHFVANCAASSTALLLGIQTFPGRRYIGNIKIHWDANHLVGDIGVMIGAVSSWGRGFGTEAIALMCDVAFHRLGLRKVVAGIYQGHTASVRAFEKCGFVLEAHLKEHVLLDGQPTNVLLMRRMRGDDTQLRNARIRHAVSP